MIRSPLRLRLAANRQSSTVVWPLVAGAMVAVVAGAALASLGHHVAAAAASLGTVSASAAVAITLGIRTHRATKMPSYAITIDDEMFRLVDEVGGTTLADAPLRDVRVEAARFDNENEAIPILVVRPPGAAPLWIATAETGVQWRTRPALAGAPQYFVDAASWRALAEALGEGERLRG